MSERKGGLGTRAPERDGRARDCYQVAETATRFVARILAHRFSKAPESWHPRDAARHALRLHAIAGELHRIGERECNEDMTCPECSGDASRPIMLRGKFTGDMGPCPRCAGDGRTTGKRKARLHADAEEIATHYGLRCYFQTDPRGCPLYLIPFDLIPTKFPDDEHDRGDWRRNAAAWIEANYTQGHAVAWLGR